MDDEGFDDRFEDTIAEAALEVGEPEFESDDHDVAHLVVFKPGLGGGLAGQTHVIREKMLIGRSPSAEIHLDTTDVSREHAVIRRVGGGKFVIQDLGSRNGTTVNEVAIQEAVLNPGDKIRIGTRTILIFAKYHPLETQMMQSQKLESLGRLAAGVAHEINNPLTYVYYNLGILTKTTSKLASEMINILSEMSQLRQRLSEVVGPEELERLMGAAEAAAQPETLESLSESLADAKDGVKRILDIIRDLRSFSSTLEDRLSPVDLNEVIEDATKIAKNEIKFRARLVKQYGEVPPVLANEGRLAQVFVNLLVNAAQAIEEGNVEQNTILVRTWSVGEEVLVKVQDSGEGVPHEHLGQIFEPFFSTKGGKIGSGLGLSICRNIINGLGGRIDVDSAVGIGTTVVVRLPRTRFQRESVKTADIPVLFHGEPSPGRVLVVDDEPCIGAAVKRALIDHHEVEFARSGEEAMRLLERDTAFDLIVMDLLMPKVTGMDLFLWIKEKFPLLAEKVVFMSGGAFTPQSMEFVRQVSNPVFEKPFELDRLLPLIKMSKAKGRLDF